LAHRDHHHHHHNHAELTKEDDKKVTEKKAETKAANVEEVSGKELKKAVKEPEIVEEPVVVVKEPKVELETTAHHASHHHSHSEKEEPAVKSTKKEVETVLDAAVEKKAETVESKTVKLPVVEESTHSSHHSSPSTHHSGNHHLTTEEEELAAEEAVAEEAVAEPIHHHHHIASLGEAEESSLGSRFGLSKPGDADYADTFEAAATALREGTAPKTRYDSKMQNIASAIVALEDELRVSSYQPLLRAFSTGSGAGNGLGLSRLGRARSRTPLLDEWVEMARRRPDRDAALSTLRAAFGTGPKARRAMRIMVNDIRKAR